MARKTSPGLVSLLVACGCERVEPPAAPPPPPAVPVARAWRGEDSPVVAVAAADADLAAAIARARATAEQVRGRWAAADERDRARWAVKWAAPTEAGGVEHVWVRPIAWTRFRVEGRLANAPRSPLECGRQAGELVSFPVEALSDWLYAPGGREGTREGGYTLDVLERRYGRP